MELNVGMSFLLGIIVGGWSVFIMSAMTVCKKLFGHYNFLRINGSMTDEFKRRNGL